MVYQDDEPLLPVDAWSENTQHENFFGNWKLFCGRKAKFIGVALFLTCAIEKSVDNNISFKELTFIKDV